MNSAHAFELRARAACARPVAPSRSSQGAGHLEATDHARRNELAPSLVPGRDVPADQGRWLLALPASDPGDLYSRKLVGREVHDKADAQNAAALVCRTALVERIATLDSKPVLHGDNGATLKATTVQMMPNWLGVKPSYSRPRVSDYNAFAEALSRTAKYRPEFPCSGFVDLEWAPDWTTLFVRRYKVDHRHGGIRYVRPARRHAG